MAWVCNVCGYVEDEESPPSTCPVCGAPEKEFAERFDDDDDSLLNSKDDDDLDDFEKDLFADFDE